MKKNTAGVRTANKLAWARAQKFVIVSARLGGAQPTTTQVRSYFAKHRDEAEEFDKTLRFRDEQLETLRTNIFAMTVPVVAHTEEKPTPSPAKAAAEVPTNGDDYAPLFDTHELVNRYGLERVRGAVAAIEKVRT